MSKSDRELINKQARVLQEELRNMAPNNDPQKDEWLRKLYECYKDRFLSDNDRIWKTGSIMIPLSFAPLAILPSIESPETVHYVILGIASFLIYAIWLIIADNHRAFQNKSMAWIIAIEQSVNLVNTGEAKLGKSRFTEVITVKRMRYGVLIVLGILWVIAWIWWQ